MTITHTPLKALEILVRDLNNTPWSVFQYKSKFSTALNIAEQVIKREKAREAAPDLLDALETLADYVDERSGDNECRPLENARAAIAKATGGAE